MLTSECYIYHYRKNVAFVWKTKKRTQLVSVETRKDVKRATLHNKAYKRAGGYMVDFINLQPQEKIVTTRDVGRKREPQRQSVRGRGDRGKSRHAECSSRLYSEARQEVGVRWNSAKVEADQRWKSPIMITSFRL